MLQLSFLDEIAASLDVETEVQIQTGLNHLIQGKTVIVISHRLKSIENADKIVVMKAGTVEACEETCSSAETVAHI